MGQQTLQAVRIPGHGNGDGFGPGHQTGWRRAVPAPAAEAKSQNTTNEAAASGLTNVFIISSDTLWRPTPLSSQHLSNTGREGLS